jgi:NADPH:quinone reductase-like Zn-dependent oxidoreductase
VPALPIAALTAWYSMMDIGYLQRGKTMLVQGMVTVFVFAVCLHHIQPRR